MAKYYVQSGTLQLVVQADDAHKAALWAVHRSMQQILPIYDDEDLSPEAKHHTAMAEGWLVLGDEITVNETGFGSRGCWHFATFDVVTEWNQLMIALAELERRAGNIVGR